jgi:hypothetical protein
MTVRDIGSACELSENCASDWILESRTDSLVVVLFVRLVVAARVYLFGRDIGLYKRQVAPPD